MGWLLIILQVLAALPSVIKTIKEIMDLIRGLPKPMQADAKAELRKIIKPGSKQVSQEQLQALADFKARLKAKTANRV